MKTARLAVAVLLATSLAGAVRAADPELSRKAKALFFDRQYAEARTAWQAVLLQSRGPEADQAAFWIARASESLGESERAFKEYGAFLARRPAERPSSRRRAPIGSGWRPNSTRRGSASTST